MRFLGTNNYNFPQLKKFYVLILNWEQSFFSEYHDHFIVIYTLLCDTLLHRTTVQTVKALRINYLAIKAERLY